MGRWDPGARGRLEQAAMALYLERGFDAVTVTDIAERAGLTKRTFFRHFDDKREVLFAGSSAFQDGVVAAVLDAPVEVAPLDAVVAALAGAGALIAQRGDLARRRQDVIAGSTDLQERELIKLARLAAAVADALHRRGVADPQAGLTAQAGTAAFTTAFARWVAGDPAADFPSLVDEALDDLRRAVGAAEQRPDITAR